MLLGRQLELAAANDLLEAARGGEGGVLIFRGPAGIGRSVLVDEVMRSSEESMHVLCVTGRPGGNALPLGALIDLVAAAPDSLHGLSPLQRRVLRQASTGISTVDTRTSVALALRSLITNKALTRPVLLVVEDAHWLDDESATFLSYLAHCARKSPFAMLLTERADTSTRGLRLPWLAELPLCEVGPLNACDIEAVLHNWTGYRVNPVVSAELKVASQGNPRVLRQLVDALGKNVLVGTDPIPCRLPAVTQVREWYGEQVGKLHARAARSLAVVTAGAGEPLDVVLDAIEMNGADQSDLEHLEQGGLVRTNRKTVSLSHPLMPSLIEDLRGWLQLRYAHAALAAAWAQREGGARSQDAQRRHLLLGGLESGEQDSHGESTNAWSPAPSQVDSLHRGDVGSNLDESALTAQERRIVREITEGATNAEVAQRLFVSVKTVEYHLHNIYGKLGLRSRTQLVRRALGDSALLA